MSEKAASKSLRACVQETLQVYTEFSAGILSGEIEHSDAALKKKQALWDDFVNATAALTGVET